MSNIINYKYTNNISLLSANLELNLDNDDNKISQNIILHGRIPSSSSFDLNKYNISDNNLINHSKSNKKLISPNISKKNL